MSSVPATLWESAVAACQREIAANPRSADAHYRLGYSLKQLGRPQEAIIAYQRALELSPNLADAWNNLGNLLLDAGDLPQAIECFQKALALRPDDPTKYYNLGSAFLTAKKFDRAIESFQRAIAIAPNFPEALVQLASALIETDRAAEALPVIQRAIQLRPNDAEAHSVLGRALHKLSRADESLRCFEHALKLRPDDAATWNNLVVAMVQAGPMPDAIAAFRRLVAMQPQMHEPRVNLGMALLGEGMVEQAVAELEAAHALRPTDAQILSNLAGAYASQRQFDKAEQEYRRAIELAPDLAEIRWNLGLVQLLLGDYEQGWQNYEARWNVRQRIFHRHFEQPLWDGSDLNGRRILLHAEQGFGDAIQFVRYAPLVAARGARIILYCQPELRRIFGSVKGVQQVISGNDPAPPFDVHCPLHTLPLRFGTRVQTIPADVPYLWAHGPLVKKWQERLAEYSANFTVGIVMSGSPANVKNRERTIDLQSLEPILQLPGVSFFSLQKEKAQNNQQSSQPAANLIDWTSELTDFAETAALIEALDLVISIDTGVAHLAGALGKPVWVLLSYGGDWRYLLDREDSPWYPTMRLFRQQVRGQWHEPVDRVKSELALAAQKR